MAFPSGFIDSMFKDIRKKHDWEYDKDALKIDKLQLKIKKLSAKYNGLYLIEKPLFNWLRYEYEREELPF